MRQELISTELWRRIIRILLALALSPLAAILAVFMCTVLAAQLFGGSRAELVANLELFGLYALVVAYPTTLFLGLPLHLLLSYFKVGTIRIHALLGAVLALVVGRLILFEDVFDAFREDWKISSFYLLLIVAPGVFVAATFALIAGQPRRVTTAPRHVALVGNGKT